MPKTYNNLFEKVCSIENLYSAYNEARRNKRFKPEILDAGFNIEDEIHKLREKLIDETWQPGNYREFLCRTEVKQRIIHAPLFIDRVVHHAIVRNIHQYFEKKFIFDSYAVTVGKGQLRAVQRVQKFLQEAKYYGDVYILQCDISKYYQSMNHDVLINQISRTIRDKKLVNLWARLIKGFNDSGVGLPIGAYTSQISANIYMNPFDHFMKDFKKIKWYVRYMDDFIVISNDKKELWNLFIDIKEFIEDNLKLRLNPKSHLYKSIQGVDFAGYRIFYNHLLPRKRNIKAARRRFIKLSKKFTLNKITFRDILCRVDSFIGYLQHCNSERSLKSTLDYLKVELPEKTLYKINEIFTKNGKFYRNYS